MGTSIELCIGNVSLSYSKNFMGEDYGYLFQEDDLFRRKSDSIDYDYYDEHPEEKEELIEAEELYVRSLSRIIPRLEILGFTLEAARAEYQAIVDEAVEMSSYSELEETGNEYLTFEEFCSLACRYPLDDLKSGYIEYDTPDRDRISQGRFAADSDTFKRIPRIGYNDSYWSETSFLSERVCILSAESMLQIFALNKANEEIEVSWNFGPIVHAGWVEREAFQPRAQQRQKVLIATEGASDARILRRSLDVLRPDIADFFNFVDVDERHHFWGTGNLVKFAEGLLRIEVLNKVLFVFDNDAEGIDAFRRLENLKLPRNMRTMLLPDLMEFKTFATRGPEGVNLSDINGRAAAIECYLDLSLDQYPAPQVTWSNFKKDINTWHGVLDFKESYSKHFYDQSENTLRNGSYDISKLTKLLDALIQNAGMVYPVI
ncbi:HEPN/Toprim-associated domain-containing protein [Leptospira sp. GIMC2001]|uniref:HEPN/Toprim-associated domain-containing protein n=1 Tax=Leptospira sp. GIMC2001 TaxID=1513297 RepID=UPI00234A8FDD|nr:HEPN/Toprim-associated domain-containing protein [Leptospira sp. GIMC2001]WCL50699.1 HEPN/Toprim-associated domain-containing protein [Leptospira sp. GIMC2001]